MKRFAVPLFLAAGLAVLIALGVLLRSVSREVTPDPVTAQPPERVSTASPASPSPARPSTGTGPVPSMARPRSPERAPEAERPDERPPSLPSSDDAPPGTRYNTKNLQYGIVQLREKITANSPQLAECVRASGTRPTGNATVTFIVADRAGKILVEQADVDHDATTLTDDKLLQCFTTATSGMVFDGLPREAPAIVVTRTIALQDGTVVEDKPAKFSYLR